MKWHTGIAGVMSPTEVEVLSGIVSGIDPRREVFGESSVALGILASTKTLAGERNRYPLRYPVRERIEEIVEAVVRSLDELAGAGTDVDLCGFSFGGLVASRVAAARGHTRKLAVIGTAGHGLKSRYTLEMRNWRLAREPDALWSALRNNLAALMIHDPRDIDALAMEVHRACCTATRFRSKTISRAALLAPILEGVDAPVLLVWGEHDVTTQPEAAARSIADRRAGIEWHIVPGAGHWAQYERADEVNRLLLEWFA